jgi:PIN domain nuclease of toxin-antitoxin system
MGCPEVILLDTHVAIWTLRNEAALGTKARTLVRSALETGELAISAISFWEMALLIAKGRLRTLKDAREQRQRMVNAGLRELPLTGEIAILAVELEGLHGDPADRFIAATAIAHNAILVTADAALLSWRSKLRRYDAEK